MAFKVSQTPTATITHPVKIRAHLSTFGSMFNALPTD
jgi:hypothetical protein